MIDRRHLLKLLTGSGLLAGTAFGPAFLELLAAPAAGTSVTDIQAGQTAASLENLTISAYRQVGTLPYLKAFPRPAGGVFAGFLIETVGQHTEHAKAFNDAVRELGGKDQAGLDQAASASLVEPVIPGLKSVLDILRFVADLELVATETYAALTPAVTDKVLRSTFAGVAGVEAQHRAVLLTLTNLVEGKATPLIAIPTKAASLPASAGSVGFPEAFVPLDRARPGSEGAVP